MKYLNCWTSGHLAIVLIIFSIIGCASEPVKVEWSANHPTNPNAQEAEFVPPPNPFQEDVAAMKKQPAPDSMMKHETHEESSMQHMDHNMGMDKKGQSDSESTKKSDQMEGDHQHKGHGQ